MKTDIQTHPSLHGYTEEKTHLHIHPCTPSPVCIPRHTPAHAPATNTRVATQV